MKNLYNEWKSREIMWHIHPLCGLSKNLKRLQFPWMFSPNTCSQSPLGKHGLNFPSPSRSWIILFFSPKSKWDMRSTNLLSLAKCTQILHFCGKHLTSLYLQFSFFTCITWLGKWGQVAHGKQHPKKLFYSQMGF